MNNYELQDKLNRLQRAICCNKPKEVTELPVGNTGNGFVIFEDNLYFWDGDSWEQTGGGDPLPTFKTINGETIDDGPGNIVAGGTGLEALNEGNGFGWRLIGRDPANYGNIGLNAVDLSHSNSGSSTKGAAGLASFASGTNTTASGINSFAIGSTTIASGSQSFASGSNITTASGAQSSAFGMGNTASSLSSTVIGMWSVAAVGQNPTAFVLTDEVFKIGNGTNGFGRSNAFVVYKNGTITAPSLDNTKITTAGNKALITKEYLDANAGSSSGLEAINEGNGIGWRLIGKDPANYGNIGVNAVDFSNNTNPSSVFGATGENSTAWGKSTLASGDFSTACGLETTASGNYSTAFGTGNVASGDRSIAWGLNTIASQYMSTTWGYGSIASGSRSTAWGNATIASGFASTAFGYYNTANSFVSTVFGTYATIAAGQNLTTIVSTDELVKIGNGTDSGNRSDALTIYKNAVQKVGGITAAAASALTPEAGMIAYVTSTDATFVTTGFWKYQGGAWTPF